MFTQRSDFDLGVGAGGVETVQDGTDLFFMYGTVIVK